MRIRKTRDNLPLYVLGLLIIFLFFGICAKQQSLNARATTEAAYASEENADTHYVTLFDNEEKTVLRS